MLSVRVSEEELERVKALADKLIRKHRYLKEADVIRELIGLENTGLITKEMRDYLSLSTEPLIPLEFENPVIPDGSDAPEYADKLPESDAVFI